VDGRRKSAPLSLSPTTNNHHRRCRSLSCPTKLTQKARQTTWQFHGAVFDIFAVARFCEGTFSSKYNSNIGFSFLTSWNYYIQFEFQLNFFLLKEGNPLQRYTPRILSEDGERGEKISRLGMGGYDVMMPSQPHH
jgi:hypothetical protein